MTRCPAGLVVALVLSAPVIAGAGPFDAFKKVLSTQLDKAKKHLESLTGASAQAFTALTRGVSRLAEETKAALGSCGGASDLASSFDRVARHSIAGSIDRKLEFGNGLVKWFEERASDYRKKLKELAAEAKLKLTGVDKAYGFAGKLFRKVRDIAGGRSKYRKGLTKVLLKGFRASVRPVWCRAAKLVKAAPERTKEKFEKFFGEIVASLKK